MVYYVEHEGKGVKAYSTLAQAKKGAYAEAHRPGIGQIWIKRGRSDYIAQISAEISPKKKFLRAIYFPIPSYNPYQLYSDGKLKKLHWADDGIRMFKDE